MSYGFDFSRRPIFRPLQRHFFSSLWPRDASLSRFGWLYLGSLIIYGLVLSINTRVTWPEREERTEKERKREREKRKRVQFERKKKRGYPCLKGHATLFSKGVERAWRAGENG